MTDAGLGCREGCDEEYPDVAQVVSCDDGLFAIFRRILVALCITQHIWVLWSVYQYVLVYDPHAVYGLG